jgi:hypothetical protein
VWTTTRPAPIAAQPPGSPKGWLLDGLFVGSTGHVFVETFHSTPLPGFPGKYVGGASVDELDVPGSYLGNQGISGSGESVDGSASLSGDRHLAFTGTTLGVMGIRSLSIKNEVVSVGWTKTAFDYQDKIQSVTGNAAGELFGAFVGAPGPVGSSWVFPWGTEGANLIVKWDSAGGHAFTKNVPPSTTGVVPGNSGDVFLAGTLAPGFDLGCGPIAGSGPYHVARLDAAGACLWDRAIVGVPTAAGQLSAPLPDAAGGVIIVNSSFKGTLDIGCGPVTSAPAGSTLVARLDASGACLWSKRTDVPGLRASLFPSGDLLLGTPFTGTIDLGGGPLTSMGVADLAVARLHASSGAHVWSKSFGGTGATLDGYPVADATGRVLLSGPLTGWVDFGGGPLGSMAAQTYAVKLDGSGAFLWSHLWPDQTFVGSDPCGAVVGARENAADVTVDKLAP